MQFRDFVIELLRQEVDNRFCGSENENDRTVAIWEDEENF